MLNEMKYVYAVYLNHSFSKAAKQLYITQPALSNMVRKAEKEIGYPIFDRSTVPITVTKEGEFYIQSIEQIMSIQKNVHDFFLDRKNLNSGDLYIGGSSYFCSYFLSGIIGKFKSKYPGISLNLQEGTIHELKNDLQHDKLDLIIETALNQESKNIQKFLLGEENIILCVPGKFEINERLEEYRLTFNQVKTGKFLKEDILSVPLEEFRDTPFLLMKKGNDMHNRSLQICKNAGFTPKVSILLDQLVTSFYISCKGTGAVFMRSDLFRYLPGARNMCYYKLSDPLSIRPIYMACKKGRYITHAMRKFLELAGADCTEK